MFSQKKKKHTWIYLAGIILLVLLGIAVLCLSLADNYCDSTAMQKTNDPEYILHEDKELSVPAENRIPETAPPEEQKESSYYLLKQDKNSIKIFFSDKTGKLIELEETDIVYETLSEDDQKRLDQGIKAETREELNRLLMDYEG